MFFELGPNHFGGATILPTINYYTASFWQQELWGSLQSNLSLKGHPTLAPLLNMNPTEICTPEEGHLPTPND